MTGNEYLVMTEMSSCEKYGHTKFVKRAIWLSSNFYWSCPFLPHITPHLKQWSH